MLEVHIITNRPELDRFLRYWEEVQVSVPTIIRVLMLDYEEQEFELQDRLRVVFHKQRTFPKTTFMNQAWARNELLTYLDDNTWYVLFFDDWQRPSGDLLEEHLKYLRLGYGVCGRKVDCDKDGFNCEDDKRNRGVLRVVDYGMFWTANASAPREYIEKVNGFDNRYNGGTGGEDYDLALRMSRLGLKFVYNPEAVSYHYNHDHLGPRRPSHDLSEFKYLPEYGHYGSWGKMDSEQFEFWWDGPIKYFRCRKCGAIGIVDSIQVYQYNLRNNVIEAEHGVREVLDARRG